MMRRAEYGAVITAVVFVMAMAAAGIWFGLEEVWHRMLTLNPVVLAGLLGLSLVNYMLRAWRWYVYSQHLEYPGVAPPDRALLLRRLRHDHDAR